MFENLNDEPIYNVKAVVGQSGVSASTLRAWERRYGVPTPPRSTNGYRLYSARDIGMIRWLKARVETGLNIRQAVNLLHSDAPESGNESTQNVERKPIVSSIPENVRSYQQLHDELVESALNFDESSVENILSEAFSLYPVEDVCLRLLQPVLVTMGEGWHSGETSISAEHFVTHIIRARILALSTACPLPTRSERVVIGGAPEEFHETAILLVALFLRRRGINVIYLGQNVATERLDEALALVRPALVILAATTAQSAARLLEVAEYIGTHSAHSVTIAYGGLVFRHKELMRAHIPAFYLGNDIHSGINRIFGILDHPETGYAGFEPVPADIRSAAADYELHRAEIVLRSTLDMLAQVTEQTSESHQQVFEWTNQLALALGTALRFGEPMLLDQLVSEMLEADTRPRSRTVRPNEDKRIEAARYILPLRMAIAPLTTEASNRIIQQFLDVLTASERRET